MIRNAKDRKTPTKNKFINSPRKATSPKQKDARVHKQVAFNESDDGHSENDKFSPDSNSDWFMEYKIWKIVQCVKKKFQSNYIQNSEKQHLKRKLSGLNLKKQKIKDRKQRMMQDFVFTAYMLGLKEILKNCFLNKPITFAQAIDQVNKSMPQGVFSNTIVNRFVSRLNIRLQDMENFILPAQTSNISSLGNNLCKLEQRYPLLNNL